MLTASATDAGGCAGRWTMRDPSKLPSERTTSPVSITCLKWRRSSYTCCSGDSPKSLATHLPSDAARRVVAHLDVDLRAPPARRGHEPHRPGVVHVAADATATRSARSGRSSVISASHSTVIPAGAFAFQCDRPFAVGLHGLQVAHDPRQVPEVAPEAVELLGGPVDRDRLVRRPPGRRPAPAGRVGTAAELDGVVGVQRRDADDGRGGRRHPVRLRRPGGHRAAQHREVDASPATRAQTQPAGRRLVRMPMPQASSCRPTSRRMVLVGAIPLGADEAARCPRGAAAR